MSAAMKIEHLNMDFRRAIAVDTAEAPWLPSPSGKVWRKPLAREEAERGHATSVVRYEPGASFPRHEHPLGEEILVLDGVFSDETGDYGPGMYFRNPPGSGHAPFSREGCELLVKLHQFQSDDLTSVRIDTQHGNWRLADPLLEWLPLHQFNSEEVFLVRTLEAVPKIPVHLLGEELFVISGAISEDGHCMAAGYWLRDPALNERKLSAIANTTLWVKRGHLVQY